MNTDTKELLEQCMYPILLAENGIVTQLNQAAAARQFTVGMKISDLICAGSQEYADLTDGKLCLSLRINDTLHPATVTRTKDQDLFRLDWEYEDTALRAFALAAKQLRQPLANALLCADALNDDSRENKQLTHNLYQLHRAINNMSDAALYSAQETVNAESRDVAAFMAECMEKAGDILGKSGIFLSYNGPKQPMIGAVDAQKLERAVLNLLSNAAKFTQKGNAIEVSLCQKGDKAYIQVESEGETIPSQVNSNLFSRYLREPELEDGRWGIGLGLTLVRSTALAHNGTLLLENTQKGQRFTMSLSLKGRGNNMMRSPVLLPVDYAGGYDRFLMELSDVLPADLY